MYIFRIVFGIVFVLLFSILILGQTKSQPAKSKLEATLRKLDLEAALAIKEKDEASIAKFFTKESVTNNPRNSLTLGSTGVIEATRAGVINYHSLDRKIESVQIGTKLGRYEIRSLICVNEAGAVHQTQRMR